MRVKVRSNGLCTYPDVIVVCDEPLFEDEHVDTLLNPNVLFEVLPPSTERYDRIAKTSYYRTIESVTEHLLVAQDEVRVEHFVKQPDGAWAMFDLRSLDAIATLASIDCTLSLRDVYDKLTMDPPTRPALR
jgi:Uma2 family endonuclease